MEKGQNTLHEHNSDGIRIETKDVPRLQNKHPISSDGSPIPEDETIGDMTNRQGDIDILFDYRQPMPCTTLAFAYPFQFPE